MIRRIGLATTIAAVAPVALGFLALAPAAAQADSVSVSVTGANALQVVGDDTGNNRARCPASGITRLVEFGHGGNDVFYGDLELPTDIQGGAGKDAITGGS